MPFARIHRQNIQSEPEPIKTANQNQEEYLTECQSLLLHTPQAAPLPRWCAKLDGRNGGQITTEQPSNEKTAHPSFVNNNLHDKDR